jgi:uncharacterized protein (TIGR03382 family)
MKIAFMSSVVAALAASASASVTLSQWDLLGAPGNQASTSGIGSVNVTAANLARGAGLVGNAGANSINAAGWTGDATDYFSFGFTIASGFSANLDSLYLGSRSSGTGPGTVGIFSSLDNYASAIATINQAQGGNFVNSVINLSSLGTVSGTVEFRVYAIGNGSANGGTTGSAGTFRLTAYFANGGFDRNLQITGDVIPTPGSLALLGLAGLVAGRRRR